MGKLNLSKLDIVKIVPSMKLTAYTWKWTVGRWKFLLSITRHAVNPHPCYLAMWHIKNPRTASTKTSEFHRHESSIIFSTSQKPGPHRKPLGYQGPVPTVKFLLTPRSNGDPSYGSAAIGSQKRSSRPGHWETIHDLSILAAHRSTWMSQEISKWLVNRL